MTLARPQARWAAVLVTAIAACSTVLLQAAPKGEAPGEQSATAVIRLTESQYRHTISDIFGPEIRIAARFEPNVRIDGLLALGASDASLSPAGLEQYDSAARSIANQVLNQENRSKFVPCARTASRFDDACARSFFSKVGLRLYRRPLNKEQLDSLVDASRHGGKVLGGFDAGLRLGLSSMLVSPSFLFRIDQIHWRAGKPHIDPYSKAVRLSYFLTNSAPDSELLEAAGRGDLDRPDGLQLQVDRLIASPALAQGIRGFFWDMLQLDKMATVTKDQTIYPAFSASVPTDAEEQTMRMIVEHLLTRGEDYRRLFTARDTYMNRKLGLLYAVPVRAEKGWERYEFDVGSDRAGLLTDMSFLMSHSHPGAQFAHHQGLVDPRYLLVPGRSTSAAQRGFHRCAGYEQFYDEDRAGKAHSAPDTTGVPRLPQVDGPFRPRTRTL